MKNTSKIQFKCMYAFYVTDNALRNVNVKLSCTLNIVQNILMRLFIKCQMRRNFLKSVITIYHLQFDEGVELSVIQRYFLWEWRNNMKRGMENFPRHTRGINLKIKRSSFIISRVLWYHFVMIERKNYGVWHIIGRKK